MTALLASVKTTWRVTIYFINGLCWFSMGNYCFYSRYLQTDILPIFPWIGCVVSNLCFTFEHWYEVVENRGDFDKLPNPELIFITIGWSWLFLYYKGINAYLKFHCLKTDVSEHTFGAWIYCALSNTLVQNLNFHLKIWNMLPLDNPNFKL